MYETRNLQMINPQFLPPLTDFSDTKATTSWVNRLLEYAQRPRCVGNGGLNIRISKGRIRKEGCDKDLLTDMNYVPTYIYTNGTSNVSVIANAIEYAWLRYSDKQIVVSEAQPTTTQGDLIAIIYSNARSVVKVENYDGWGCPPSSVVFCCPEENTSSLELARADKTITEGNTEGLAYVILSQDPPNRSPKSPSEMWVQVKSNFRALFWAIPTAGGLTWMNITSSVPVGSRNPSSETWENEGIPSNIWGQLYYNETLGKLWINAYGTWKPVN